MAFPSVPAGQWVELANTKLSASGQLHEDLGLQKPPQGGGPSNITRAYNGALYDSKRDRLVLLAAGGHGDYGGNEVYGFSVVDTQAWTLLKAATSTIIPIRGSGTITLTSGNPSVATTVSQTWTVGDYIHVDNAAPNRVFQVLFSVTGTQVTVTPTPTLSVTGVVYDRTSQVAATIENGLSPNRIVLEYPQFPAVTDRQAPCSRHNYYQTAYLPNQDRYFMTGGSAWSGSGGEAAATWFYDPNTDTWEFIGFPPSTVGKGNNSLWYDRARGTVITKGYNSLLEFDPAAKAWLTRSPQDAGDSEGANFSFVDPIRHWYITFGWRGRIDNAGFGARYYDLNKLPAPGVAGTVAPLTMTFTQDSNGYWNLLADGVTGSSTGDSEGAGHTYDSVRKRCTIWPASNGTIDGVLKYSGDWNDIFYIDIDDTPATPTLEVKKDATLTGAAVKGSKAWNGLNVRGHYGRFQYIEGQDAFVLVTSFSGNVYLSRLSDGSKSLTLNLGWSRRNKSELGFPDSALGTSAGTKHNRMLYDTTRNQIVWTGGDVNGGTPSGGTADGNQQMWRGDLKASIDNATVWTQLAPPGGGRQCFPSVGGYLMPDTPDNVTWGYDALNDRYLMMPGYMSGNYASFGCTLGDLIVTENPHNWNTTTNRWEAPPWSAPPSGYGGDGNSTNSAVYDPKTTSFYRLHHGGSAERVQRLNLSTNVWTEFSATGNVANAHAHREMAAFDRYGRKIYWRGITHMFGAPILCSFNVDTNVFKDEGLLPATMTVHDTFTSTDTLLFFDPLSRILLCPTIIDYGTGVKDFWTYDLARATWTQQSLPNAYTTYANIGVFDPTYNVLIIQGASGAQDPYYYLYRHAGGPVAATPKSITASTGAFTLTGVNVVLATSQTKKLTAEVGSFSLTGPTTGLLVGRLIEPKRGTSDIAPLANTYRLTGFGIALTVNAQRVLPANQGTFDLTGQPVTLIGARTISATAGAFTLTGIAADLRAKTSITASTGSFVLTGVAADLRRTAQILKTDVLQLNLTGQSAALRYSPQLHPILGAETADLKITGFPAILTGPGESGGPDDWEKWRDKEPWRRGSHEWLFDNCTVELDDPSLVEASGVLTRADGFIDPTGG